MNTIVVVSGGFDPVHSGHIKLLKQARLLGDMLIVGINSDEWLSRKKGRAFMPWTERLCVINNLSMVDEVYTFDDEDGTACHLLEQVQAHYPTDRIVFANGGDRTPDNIPEMSMQNIIFKFGVGGSDKSNSSSWILEEWKAPKTLRPWGYYRVLHEVEGMKVKELTIDPGQSLSMQRHNHRAEYWLVSSGSAIVNSQSVRGYQYPPKLITKHQEHCVPVGEWHQLTNPFNEPCKIVEIQHGDSCNESDIERKDSSERSTL
jgi:cytidyltransferase-like protein